MDTNNLIVEAAKLIVNTDRDLIDLAAVPELFKKKADSINRCLQFIRTSEKKLFALQQKLLETAQTRQDMFGSNQPYPPDLNLLNQELLEIAKRAAPDIYQQFIELALVKERQKEKQRLAERKAQGEIINPDQIIHWIPRIVDAVVFLHAPFEVFNFLNFVREMVCLVQTDERRLYLLNYMERWIYKFTDFLQSYASGLGNDALLTVCFIGQHQNYPTILEVLRFLHLEEHFFAGPVAQIQRYNVVRLFLLFKKVLFLHLKRKQMIPQTFNAILSEFTHPFIVEEVDFANDPLMMITLGFYNEPQRFQFLANLKKLKVESFVALYQQLLFLVDASSKQPPAFKEKYLEILKTIGKIIKRSHMLTDPEIPAMLRQTLRRELSRQILTEESLRKPGHPAPNAAPVAKRLSPEEKLNQLHKKAVITTPVNPPVSLNIQSMALVGGSSGASSKKEALSSPPPPPVEIVVYAETPMERRYDQPEEVPLPLLPDQVTTLVGWNYADISIFQSPDVLGYLLGNFKARGNLKFAEMLELARVPFRFEFFTRTKERHLRFVNLAHLIGMTMKPEEAKIVLGEVQRSGQISEEETRLLLQIYPQLLDDAALGMLVELCPNRQSFTVDGQIKTKFFYEKYEIVMGNLLKQYPYFQQLIAYWDFLDHLLSGLAKKLDREACPNDYEQLTPAKLERYLAKQQVDLFNRILSELKFFASSFLANYLPPRLGDLLEYKFTPDLMSLCQSKAVKLP